MSMFFEILFHDGVIFGTLRAELMSFQAVFDLLVIIHHSKAGVSFGCVSPTNELVPVAALHDLAVPDRVFDPRYWHGSIVGFAYYILSDTVEAVVDMTGGNGLFESSLVIGKRFAKDFLYVSLGLLLATVFFFARSLQDSVDHELL